MNHIVVRVRVRARVRVGRVGYEPARRATDRDPIRRSSSLVRLDPAAPLFRRSSPNPRRVAPTRSVIVVVDGERGEARGGDLDGVLLRHLHDARFARAAFLSGFPVSAPSAASRLALRLALAPAPLGVALARLPGGATAAALSVGTLGTLGTLGSILLPPLPLREAHLIVELEGELRQRRLRLANRRLELLLLLSILHRREARVHLRDVILDRLLVRVFLATNARAAGQREVLLDEIATSLLERRFARARAAEDAAAAAGRGAGVRIRGTRLEVETRAPATLAVVAVVAVVARGKIGLSPAIAGGVGACTRARSSAIVAIVAGRGPRAVAKAVPIAFGGG